MILRDSKKNSGNNYAAPKKNHWSVKNFMSTKLIFSKCLIFFEIENYKTYLRSRTVAFLVSLSDFAEEILAPFLKYK